MPLVGCVVMVVVDEVCEKEDDLGDWKGFVGGGDDLDVEWRLRVRE